MTPLLRIRALGAPTRSDWIAVGLLAVVVAVLVELPWIVAAVRGAL